MSDDIPGGCVINSDRLAGILHKFLTEVIAQTAHELIKAVLLTFRGWIIGRLSTEKVLEPSEESVLFFLDLLLWFSCFESLIFTV